MANELMVFFTGVIALATLLYAGVTFKLWRATKQSADAATAAAHAARLSAEAAKRSAEMEAALHRPYVGVAELQRHNDWNAEKWEIRCRVKNYGTLPASDVRVDVVIGQRPGDSSDGGGPLWDHSEILPQADVESFLAIGIDKNKHIRLSGGEPMVAQVKITYFALDGAPYTHTANFPYDGRTQNFKVNGSETKDGCG